MAIGGVKNKCVEIIIETENDAFSPEPHLELSRILKHIAHNIDTHRILEQSIKDINGNTVGHLKIVGCKHGE
jgi:uncharacterized protein YihD (DUF1040 family)